MRIDRVYTRTGDEGQTSLTAGERVSKSSLRVAGLGEVDELNSLLGVARSRIQDEDLDSLLQQLQNNLFVLGADLSMPVPVESSGPAARIRRVGHLDVESIEDAIDQYSALLPPLEEFILPGGGETGSLLHLSRAVARRAERTVVALSEAEKKAVNPVAIVYLNRLSDLLFVLARWTNRDEGYEESLADFH